MTGRTPLLNVVVALLIVGGVLILISWAGPAQNIQTALLAAALAILHFAAALGIALRRSWGRIVGLVIGWIGVFGSGAVLVSLVPALPSLLFGAAFGPGPFLVALGISAAMLAGYLTVLVALLRSRATFDTEAGGQLG